MNQVKKLEISTDEELGSAPCMTCERDTNHKTLAKVYVLYSDDYIDWDYKYRIIQCQGCLDITFSNAYTCSEDVDYDHHGQPYHPTTWEYYPNRITGRNKMRDTHHLPPEVASIYHETYNSLCTSQFIMTGFGIRAIVEAICNDKQVNGDNLQLKIEGLKKAGHITNDGALILHNLRFMGNEAAHELKVHKRNELESGFDVLEHLLQGVYVMPEQAKKLPQYKSQK